MKNTKKSIDDNPFINSEEDKLLLTFISGDDKAYASIYNKYADELFSYGIGLGFMSETLKDAIHDVFYKLYFNRKLLTNVDNLKYYLFRMLKNRLLDISKSGFNTSDISDYELSFSIKVTILEELIGEEERVATQQKIEKLLNSLTDRQREAIYLRFMQEMSYEEIGNLLQMTPQSARKLIFRAMERMREQNLSLLFFLMLSTSLPHPKIIFT